MHRKPASVISALRRSSVFITPIEGLLRAESSLFSHPDKRKDEALVAEVSGKSFCLEDSLLSGFTPQNYLAAARRIGKVWSFDNGTKIARPRVLSLVPAPRRSGEAARASVVYTLGQLGLGLGGAGFMVQKPVKPPFPPKPGSLRSSASPFCGAWGGGRVFA